MKNINFLKNQLFAHRGVYDNVRIYENTISAFTRAIKYNYAIELDVRLTKDMKIVVFHDENMERLLHVDEKIESITYEELCYIAKYQIPLLTDVLNTVKGSVPLLIDLKTQKRKYPLEIELAKILDNYDGYFAICTFSIRSLRWFYKNRKDYVIGYNIGLRNYKKDPFFKKYDFINLRIKSLSEKKLKFLKEKYILLGWGVSNSEEFTSSKSIYDSLVIDNILEITTH